MNIEEMRAVVLVCKFPEYQFEITEDSRGAIYLQGHYKEEDTETGIVEWQKTRRWFLNPEMTQSEIVQTVFKLVMTSMEHRTREWFTFRGEPIFGPHFDVEVLWDVCNSVAFDTRKPLEPKPRIDPYAMEGCQCPAYTESHQGFCLACGKSVSSRGAEAAAPEPKAEHWWVPYEGRVCKYCGVDEEDAHSLCGGVASKPGD